MELIVFLGMLAVTYAIGSWIERRHFEDLAARERRARSMVVTTFETHPPDWQVERAELVTGSVVVSLDYFKRILEGVRAIFGGRLRAYEPLLERARREALLRMVEDAHARGHRHVINVRLETARLANTRRGGESTAGVEILAYGTALKVARSTDPASA